MSRFFLHVLNGVGDVRDGEGIEVESLDAAVAQAKEGIRSIVGDEARRGRIDMDGRVEIADESGRLCAVVPFPEAFEFVAAGARAHPGN